MRMNGKLIYIFAILGLAIVMSIAVYGNYLVSPNSWLGTYHVKNIWDTWELAAALWSITFFGYYFIDYKSIGNEFLDKLINFVLIVSSLLIPGAILYYLLVDYHSERTIWLTVVLNWIYLTIDAILAWKHSDDLRRRTYREAFLLADVPIVISNSCFLAWLFAHQQTTGWLVFASGMVGFQLLSCNIIFVITQTGAVRAIWSRQPG